MVSEHKKDLEKAKFWKNKSINDLNNIQADEELENNIIKNNIMKMAYYLK